MAFRWKKSAQKSFDDHVAGNGKLVIYAAHRWGMLINKFVPAQTRTLAKSARAAGIDNKKAILRYASPYARRQYYGKTWQRGGHKFSRNVHPLASHRWHEVGIKRGLKRTLFNDLQKFIRRNFR